MNLLLLTSRFPFMHSENFPELELPYLSQTFDRIDIVPVAEIDTNDVIRYALPANVHVRIEVSRRIHEKIKQRRQVLTSPFIDFFTMARNVLRNRSWAIKDVIAHRIEATAIARSLTELLQIHDYGVAYSYWLSPAALAIVDMKKKFERLKGISRAHALDLFSETSNKSHLPYQYETIRGLDRVFPCSAAGEHDLISKYPEVKNHVASRYLGVRTQETLCAKSTDNVLRVVSCARVEIVKRIDLLASALREMDLPIIWTHIGDGSGLNRVKEIAKSFPSQVVAHFPGSLRPEKVLDFYRNNPVDWFVNVSLTEGIPVSIMEAMSFGIPCCATDVGGTGEIVDSKNGYLLPEDFTAQQLLNVLRGPKETADDKRQSAVQTQRTRFDAGINYGKFASELGELARQTK